MITVLLWKRANDGEGPTHIAQDHLIIRVLIFLLDYELVQLREEPIPREPLAAAEASLTREQGCEWKVLAIICFPQCWLFSNTNCPRHAGNGFQEFDIIGGISVCRDSWSFPLRQDTANVLGRGSARGLNGDIRHGHGNVRAVATAS